MKRYLVFSSSQYYPRSGMNDCILKTNDLDEAMACFKYATGDIVTIYDLEEDRTVEDRYSY